MSAPYVRKRRRKNPAARGVFLFKPRLLGRVLEVPGSMMKRKDDRDNYDMATLIWRDYEMDVFYFPEPGTKPELIEKMRDAVLDGTAKIRPEEWYEPDKDGDDGDDEA